MNFPRGGFPGIVGREAERFRIHPFSPETEKACWLSAGNNEVRRNSAPPTGCPVRTPTPWEYSFQATGSYYARALYCKPEFTLSRVAFKFRGDEGEHLLLGDTHLMQVRFKVTHICGNYAERRHGYSCEFRRFQSRARACSSLRPSSGLFPVVTSSPLGNTAYGTFTFLMCR